MNLNLCIYINWLIFVTIEKKDYIYNVYETSKISPEIKCGVPFFFSLFDNYQSIDTRKKKAVVIYNI